ncbi:sugar ABC transporter permease [Thermococcus sp. SY098]|uniref:carbohydrate ABC transporter permease n=1 Tax=Thermococcus sp. SY098 TaxID=3111325 RepID=UPI002D7746DD|nr:sugar ABC transporter permease [Thermococcus sp. SY098]WRS52019.1 sugar ABC transporter permease [Thermococcus sp. SY098]
MGRRINRDFFILMTPAFILLFIFIIYPILNTFYLGFTKWDGFTNPQFVGLENYKTMMNDPLFWTSVKNNFFIFIIFLPLVTLLGLGFALLLHNKAVVGRNVLRGLVMLGMVMPLTVVGIVWMLLLDPYSGIVNKIIEIFGGQPRAWIQDPSTAIYFIIIGSLWAWQGFTTTVFLAGLEGLDVEVLEASVIDGANPWQRFRYVILPLLKPALIVVVTMSSIYILKVFDLIYVLSGGESIPMYLSVLAYMIYYEIFYMLKWGYAAAIATLLTVAVFLFSIGMLKRMIEERGVEA